jgi:hypothetical protein
MLQFIALHCYCIIVIVLLFVTLLFLLSLYITYDMCCNLSIIYYCILHTTCAVVYSVTLLLYYCYCIIVIYYCSLHCYLLYYCILHTTCAVIYSATLLLYYLLYYLLLFVTLLFILLLYITYDVCFNLSILSVLTGWSLFSRPQTMWTRTVNTPLITEHLKAFLPNKQISWAHTIINPGQLITHAAQSINSLVTPFASLPKPSLHATTMKSLSLWWWNPCNKPSLHVTMLVFLA